MTMSKHIKRILIRLGGYDGDIRVAEGPHFTLCYIIMEQTRLELQEKVNGLQNNH